MASLGKRPMGPRQATTSALTPGVVYSPGDLLSLTRAQLQKAPNNTSAKTNLSAGGGVRKMRSTDVLKKLSTRQVGKYMPLPDEVSLQDLNGEKVPNMPLLGPDSPTRSRPASTMFDSPRKDRHKNGSSFSRPFPFPSHYNQPICQDQEYHVGYQAHPLQIETASHGQGIWKQSQMTRSRSQPTHLSSVSPIFEPAYTKPSPPSHLFPTLQSVYPDFPPRRPLSNPPLSSSMWSAQPGQQKSMSMDAERSNARDDTGNEPLSDSADEHDCPIAGVKRRGRSLSDGAELLARQGTLLHPSFPARSSQELSVLLGQPRSRRLSRDKLLPPPPNEGPENMKVRLEASKKRSARVEVDVVLEKECVVEGGEVRGRMEVKIHRGGKSRDGMRVGEGKIRVVGFEELSPTLRNIFYHHTYSLPIFDPSIQHTLSSSLFASGPDRHGYRESAEGNHDIPFRMALPLNKGAKGTYTTHGGKGPCVRYVVVASIKIYLPVTGKRSIAHFYRPIVVLPYLDPAIILSASPEPIEAYTEKGLGWSLKGERGRVELRVGLGRRTWVSGQRMWCEVEIRNESNKKIKSVSLALLQTVHTFPPQSVSSHTPKRKSLNDCSQLQRKKINEEVTEADNTHGAGRVTGKCWWTGVEPGEDGKWDMSLQVPAGLLSIQKAKFIEISYTLRVTLNSSIYVDLPVDLISFLSIDPPPMPSGSKKPWGVVNKIENMNAECNHDNRLPNQTVHIPTSVARASSATLHAGDLFNRVADADAALVGQLFQPFPLHHTHSSQKSAEQAPAVAILSANSTPTYPVNSPDPTTSSFPQHTPHELASFSHRPLSIPEVNTIQSNTRSDVYSFFSGLNLEDEGDDKSVTTTVRAERRAAGRMKSLAIIRAEMDAERWERDGLDINRKMNQKMEQEKMLSNIAKDEGEVVTEYTPSECTDGDETRSPPTYSHTPAQGLEVVEECYNGQELSDVFLSPKMVRHYQESHSQEPEDQWEFESDSGSSNTSLHLSAPFKDSIRRRTSPFDDQHFSAYPRHGKELSVIDMEGNYLIQPRNLDGKNLSPNLDTQAINDEEPSQARGYVNEPVSLLTSQNHSQDKQDQLKSRSISPRLDRHTSCHDESNSNLPVSPVAAMRRKLSSGSEEAQVEPVVKRNVFAKVSSKLIPLPNKSPLRALAIPKTDNSTTQAFAEAGNIGDSQFKAKRGTLSERLENIVHKTDLGTGRRMSVLNERGSLGQLNIPGSSPGGKATSISPLKVKSSSPVALSRVSSDKRYLESPSEKQGVLAGEHPSFSPFESHNNNWEEYQLSSPLSSLSRVPQDAVVSRLSLSHPRPSAKHSVGVLYEDEISNPSCSSPSTPSSCHSILPGMKGKIVRLKNRDEVLRKITVSGSAMHSPQRVEVAQIKHQEKRTPTRTSYMEELGNREKETETMVQDRNLLSRQTFKSTFSSNHPSSSAYYEDPVYALTSFTKSTNITSSRLAEPLARARAPVAIGRLPTSSVLSANRNCNSRRQLPELNTDSLQLDPFGLEYSSGYSGLQQVDQEKHSEQGSVSSMQSVYSQMSRRDETVDTSSRATHETVTMKREYRDRGAKFDRYK
nr:hypothetical protein L203_04756 [Cryptococcus depauperatus CBS 7841]